MPPSLFQYTPPDAVDGMRRRSEVIERVAGPLFILFFRRGVAGDDAAGNLAAVGREQSGLRLQVRPKRNSRRASSAAARIAATMPLPSAGALPGAIERRAVGGKQGADDRQAERDVHRSVHRQELQRDMPLVVIHRHHGVELAVAGADHQRVGGQWAGGSDAGGAGHADGRRDDQVLLVAEEFFFAGVGVRAQTPILGSARPKPSRIRMFARRHLAAISPGWSCPGTERMRAVEGRVDDAEARAGVGGVRLRQIEHHREVVDAAELGQELGMAGVVVARGVEGGLAEGRRHQAGELPGDRAAGGEDDSFRSAAWPERGSSFAGRGVEDVVAADREARDA